MPNTFKVKTKKNIGTADSAVYTCPSATQTTIIGMNLANTTTGSVLGAILGYFIGYIFFNEIGLKIFELYGVDNTSFLKDKVSSDGGIITWMTLLAIAGFTPVPFKLLTITSGFVHFNIFYFIIISILTRGTRFFIIAFLIGNFGPTMKKIIEKKLITFSIIFTVIVIIVAYLVYKFLINFVS